MSRRTAAAAAEQDALAAEYGAGPSQSQPPYSGYGYGYAGYGTAYGSYGYGRSAPYGAASGATSSPYAGASTASPYGGASSAASPYAAGAGASTARGTWGSYAQQRTAEDLEEGNDARIEGLSARVKLLRDITSGIGSEVREGNTDLSSLTDLFSGATASLSTNFGRMTRMARRQKGWWCNMMIFLIFVIWIFIFLWWWRR